MSGVGACVCDCWEKLRGVLVKVNLLCFLQEVRNRWLYNFLSVNIAFFRVAKSVKKPCVFTIFIYRTRIFK